MKLEQEKMNSNRENTNKIVSTLKDIDITLYAMTVTISVVSIIIAWKHIP